MIEDFVNPNPEYDPMAPQIMFAPGGVPTILERAGVVSVSQEFVAIVVEHKNGFGRRLIAQAEDETQARPVDSLIPIHFNTKL